MTISKAKYQISREPIKLWLETKPYTDIDREISHMALYTGAPVIIVIEYVMEVLGRTEELLAKQRKLMDFYHVSAVVDWHLSRRKAII